MKKPNVIFIYADDLGRGMLSCYGQQKFKTPNIDRIANEGLQFENSHGCHICAPARASLLCGVHDSHRGAWGFTSAGLFLENLHGRLSEEKIDEMLQKSGIDRMTDGYYLPMVFKDAGYKTYQVGKLDWGFTTCAREVVSHGWDEHYGFYDHWVCQGYYAPEIHENGKAIKIEGNNDPNCGRAHFVVKDGRIRQNGDNKEMHRIVYTPDLVDAKALEYIEKSKDEPFFLYYPSQIPHVALSISEIDSEIDKMDDLTLLEKVYASMVLHLDRSVGKIYAKLEELGILENTLIVFSSDNGHAPSYTRERLGLGQNGGLDKYGRKLDDLNVRYTTENYNDIFDGNSGRTGKKGSNFEGGTNVPLLMRLPGTITAGTKTNALVSNYDFFNTMAEMLEIEQRKDKDSKSYWKLLQGNDAFEEHDHIVFAGGHGPAIISKNGFKLRSYLKDNYKIEEFGSAWDKFNEMVILELYDLNNDYKEENNVIEQYPEIADKLLTQLLQECDGNLMHGTVGPHFVFVGDRNFEPLYSTNKSWTDHIRKNNT